MFLFITSRSGDIHMVDFQFTNQRFSTFCGQTISLFKKNTLGLDAPIDNVCKQCKNNCNYFYSFMLKDFKTVKGCLYYNLQTQFIILRKSSMIWRKHIKDKSIKYNNYTKRYKKHYE